MVIPYIDINPKGNGYYTFAERKFEMLTYFFGFHVLWVSLIIIGTFLRGPGWNWFWPWEKWDLHKVEAMTNVDLPYLVARRCRARGFLHDALVGDVRMVIGGTSWRARWPCTTGCAGTKGKSSCSAGACRAS